MQERAWRAGGDRPREARHAARQLLEGIEQLELTEEQRAAMTESDRGKYIDGEVFLRELGIRE